MYLRFALALFFLAPFAHGEVLFEAFYRIEREGKHVGYFIQRVSNDMTAGTKTVTMYTRQRQIGDQEMFNSYRSVAKLNGNPVSSRYSSNFTGSVIDIVAGFKNGIAKITTGLDKTKSGGSTANKVNHMSAFLFLLTDLRRLAPGTHYEYKTYAEEAGRRADGTLFLAGQKNLGSQRIFHVVNDFMGQVIESFVTENGEPLAARQPAGDSVVFWVPRKEDAVGLFSYPTAEFTALFGDLPEGKKNPWMQAPIQVGQFIKGFKRSMGSRELSSKKPRNTAPLPLRKM